MARSARKSVGLPPPVRKKLKEWADKSERDECSIIVEALDFFLTLKVQEEQVKEMERLALENERLALAAKQKILGLKTYE